MLPGREFPQNTPRSERGSQSEIQYENPAILLCLLSCAAAWGQTEAVIEIDAGKIERSAEEKEVGQTLRRSYLRTYPNFGSVVWPPTRMFTRMVSLFIF